MKFWCFTSHWIWTSQGAYVILVIVDRNFKEGCNSSVNNRPPSLPLTSYGIYKRKIVQIEISTIAQGKRAGLITLRSLDRNQVVLLVFLRLLSFLVFPYDCPSLSRHFNVWFFCITCPSLYRHLLCINQKPSGEGSHGKPKGATAKRRRWPLVLWDQLLLVMIRFGTWNLWSEVTITRYDAEYIAGRRVTLDPFNHCWNLAFPLILPNSPKNAQCTQKN